MSFSAVYNQIIILFSLIIVGYVCGKLEVITKEMVKNFTTFILQVASPALIIGGMIIPRTPEKLKASIAILIISFSIYGGSLIFGKLITKIIRPNQSQGGIFEFSLVFSNVVFMGFPVLQTVFGKEAIFYAAIYNIAFNILVYTVGIALVSTQKETHKINFKAFINPGAIASIVGFIIFVLAIPVAGVIKGVMNLVGSVTTPLSMLVIGAMLSALPLSKMFNNWRIYVVSLLRVLVLPLIVYGLLKFVFKIDNMMLVGVPVIVTAMPVAANAALMVQEYGSEPGIAS